MNLIRAALEPLDSDARRRALQWAISRYMRMTVGNDGTPTSGTVAPASAAAASPYETFADLYDAARPETDAEKALIAAYWQQVCCTNPNFSAQSLNSALKDMGHGVSNITMALDRLKDQQPALVLQLTKSGSSKQARKTYKMSTEGVRRVQAIILEQADEHG